MSDYAASYPKLGLFINGEWEAGEGRGMDVVNPSDETVLGRVPFASPAQLERALAAAQKGFLVWRDMGPEARYNILMKAAALLRERAETVARIITLEQGKTIADSRHEVMRGAVILEWDAAQGSRVYGRINPSVPGFRNMVLRQPIGPVAAFTPWNAPIGSPTRKMSGALAAGCSIVIKAAEETPGAACALVQCLADAGVPAGALNLVFGNPGEVSEQLIASPVIRMITFTGSVPIGKHLAQLAAAQMKPAIMELGGHAPIIVCGDVDAAKVGQMSAMAKFRMAGQICVSPTRFIVQDNVYETFVEAFGTATRALKVGDGFAEGVQMGPLANGRRLGAVTEMVDDAVRSGARLIAGGQRVGDKGFFFAPTVLSDVPDSARLMNSEPFGPIAAVVRFKTLDEAIGISNRLSLGLQSYAFTNSAENAARIADRVECGIMSINHFGGPGADMPFGGVKDSGIGREGGNETLDSYLVSKMVSHRTISV
ncbi:MAG: NAD-dependent succinate-semialdehyde dehydrogenase [Janthinobacterium lividum]